MEGELRLKGPQCFLGYVDASLDAQAFDADGWFRTGDLGRIDDDGNVVVSGRIKDAIIRNAENISALEIEGVLASHPGVADVAVIGVPNERTGERVAPSSSRTQARRQRSRRCSNTVKLEGSANTKRRNDSKSWMRYPAISPARCSRPNYGPGSGVVNSDQRENIRHDVHASVDMRAPSIGASPTELYAAASEMAAWAETRGCVAAVLCEHHCADDGYLPSPLMLGAAIAARTDQLMLNLVIILPFYDTARLAEDMAVLDHISAGRASYVFGIGYRAEEFAHFGLSQSDRGRLAEQKLGILRRLLAGEAVEHDGRRMKVTPRRARREGR